MAKICGHPIECTKQACNHGNDCTCSPYCRWCYELDCLRKIIKSAWYDYGIRGDLSVDTLEQIEREVGL